MLRALAAEQALQPLRGHTKLARHEEARAGGSGSLRDGHLSVDGHEADRGDDDVRAGEGRCERGHVGVFGGGETNTARCEGLVLCFVAGGLWADGIAS